MKKTPTTNSIRPLGDRVLIKEQTEGKETKTKSGIIIPINAQEDKGSKRGVVVAIGPGRYEEGKLVPMNVSVGDEILFQWGDKIKHEAEEYYLVRESEVIAIVTA